MKFNKEQIIQEFALDGAVKHVRFEVIRQVCLHSKVTGCQPTECFCYIEQLVFGA